MASRMYNGERYILHTFRYQCNLCDTIVTPGDETVRCKCNRMKLDGRTRLVTGTARDMRCLNVWRTETKPYKYIPQEEVDRQFAKLVSSMEESH